MKITLRSIIAITILILLGYTYLQYVNIRKINVELNAVKHEQHDCQDDLQRIKEKALLMSQMEILVPPSTPIISARGSATLESIVKNRTLVYAFSYKDCLDCAQNQLQILSKLKTIDEIEVLIIISYDNIRTFKNLAKLSDNKIPTIGLSNDKLINNQCFFVLESNGIGRNIYIPEIEEDGFTTKYLEKITEKFSRPSKTYND